MPPRSGPPWSRICSLEVRYAGGSGELATGWSASRRTIVTAAHSVLDSTGAIADKVHGWLGRYRNYPAYGFVVSRQDIAIAPRWFENRDDDWDLAVLRLREPIPGIYAYLACNEMQQRGIVVDRRRATLAGYRKSATDVIDAIEDIELKVAGRRLRYQAATDDGMSGSPIFVNHDGQAWVVGVHTDSGAAATQAVFLDDVRASWIDSCE